MSTSPPPSSQNPAMGASPDLGGASKLGDPLAGIDAAAIAAFNALLASVAPDATPIDAAQLGAMAGQLLAKGPEQAKAAASLQRSLQDIALLSRMSADPAWRLPETDKERIGKVNEYFKSENDLIPDDVPEIGLLDDAILIELVGRALRPELDDYADFCKQRELRARTSEPGAPEFERRDWLALKRAQARASGVRSSFR